MDGRDEKGRFAKGNNIGNQFVKNDGRATENGRKGGCTPKKNRIEKWLQIIDGKGAHPLTKEEAVSIDAYLLTLTFKELQETLSNPEVPIVVQARAKQLGDSLTTFETTEKMLDRVFGKPKQQQDMTVSGGGFALVLDNEGVDIFKSL